MKGSGTNFTTLFRKFYFMLIPTCGQRTRYIYKNRHLFRRVGKQLMFQPRHFPSDPELISFGDNVLVASDVCFINHDIIAKMLNQKYNSLVFKGLGGGIEIGDNVMIGTGSKILPDVRIGSNVIIAAGSVVSKDIPDNCVAGGVPARIIGNFDNLVEKRKNLKVSYRDGVDKIWQDFYEKRNKKENI